MRKHETSCHVEISEEINTIYWIIRNIADWICNVPYCRLSQRQIAFLGPLEYWNLFGQKSKVISFQKLILWSSVRFLILFVLMDAIFWNCNISVGAKGNICFFCFSQSVYGKDQFPHKISNGCHRNTFFARKCLQSRHFLVLTIAI